MRRFLFTVFLLAAGLVVIFVLVVKAAPPASKDDFGMGISTHLRVGTSGLSTSLVALKQLGVGWIQEEIPWDLVQQSSDAFQWSFAKDAFIYDFDALVSQASDQKLQVLVVLDGGPVFLPHGYPGLPINSDLLLQSWKTYVQAVVERYGDRIDYWQIGRDVNKPGYYGKLLYPTVEGAVANPDPALYEKLLQSAYEIIKAKDSGDTIILGGLEMGSSDCTSNPFSFLGELQAADAWKYFDALGVDIFRGSAWPEQSIARGNGYDVLSGACILGTTRNSSLLEELRSLKAFTNQYGSKPIWITEIGYHAGEIQHLADARGSASAVVESDLLARTLVPLLSEPYIDKVFWYTYLDEPDNSSWALGPFGQLTYSNLSSMLRGTRAEGLIIEPEMPADLEEYRFEKNGQSIILLWRTSGGESPQVVTLHALQGDSAVAYPADSVEFSTSTGFRLEVSPEGTALVQVGERPLIIVAQSSDALEQMKAGAEDQIAGVQEAVKAGANNLLDDAKTAISNQMSEWLNSLKESFMQSIQEKLEQIFK